MATKEQLKIVVEGYTFPSPLSGTYSVKKIKYNAYAERTAKSMRIDQLGDVWEVSFTLPNLPEQVYSEINNALEPFVVEVSFWNTWLNRRMITTFYHTDLELVRLSQDLHLPINLKFIGTEVI